MLIRHTRNWLTISSSRYAWFIRLSLIGAYEKKSQVYYRLQWSWNDVMVESIYVELGCHSHGTYRRRQKNSSSDFCEFVITFLWDWNELYKIFCGSHIKFSREFCFRRCLAEIYTMLNWVYSPRDSLLCDICVVVLIFGNSLRRLI